jgi:microcin C transport system substrate-binding protein
LPVEVGRRNFDNIVLDYYRDDTVAFEAFKAGKVDYRDETVRNWATAYDFPAFRAGAVKKLELPKNDDIGLYAFAFNIRREKFGDPRVREALSYAWDFNWANKNLYYGAYVQSRSFYGDSDLAAKGLPSPAELKLLDPFRDTLPPRVFTQEYNPPVTDGSGNNRANLEKAVEILRSAGWAVKNGKMTNMKTGEALHIDFFYVQSDDEKLYTAFARNLNRIGIGTTLRQVDASEAIRRLESRDFDIYAGARYFRETHSPGNEQREYFGSASADNDGSFNIVGIKNKAVDAIIEKIIFARDEMEMETATRALDRVLQWNFYTVPLFRSAVHRIGIWDRFGRPETMAKYALGLVYAESMDDTWWIDPAKDAAVMKYRQTGK